MKHKLEIFILLSGLTLGFLLGYLRGYRHGLQAYQTVLSKACEGDVCNK